MLVHFLISWSSVCLLCRTGATLFYSVQWYINFRVLEGWGNIFFSLSKSCLYSRSLWLSQCLYLSGDEKGGRAAIWVLHRAWARQTSKTTKNTLRKKIHAAFTFVSYQPHPEQMHLEEVWNLTLRRKNLFPVHAAVSSYILQNALTPNWIEILRGYLYFLCILHILWEEGDWPILICALHMSELLCKTASQEDCGRPHIKRDLMRLKMAQGNAGLDSSQRDITQALSYAHAYCMHVYMEHRIFLRNCPLKCVILHVCMLRSSVGS